MHKLLAAAGFVGLLLTPAVSVAAPAIPVKICTDRGPGFYYIPGTDTCVNAQTGQTYNSFTGEEGTIDALKGVALSLALPNATIDDGKTFGAAVGIGTFGGATAIGIGGAVQAGEGLTVNGAIGVGLDGGPVGGRAGVNFSW